MGRSWLPDGTDTSDVLTLRSDLATRHDALVASVWRAGVDPVLLELCRIRMAQLLGDAAGVAARSPQAVVAGLSEQLVVRLDEWWSFPSFGEPERTALAIAEQFVVDVHGVSDERFAALAAHLGPDGAVAFSMALALFDGQSRLRRAFTAPDLESGGSS